MLYRRKVILALLEVFGGSLEKISLQKLLFLACQKQKKPTFHFVPYKYGCFSFLANSDLTIMSKKGMILSSEKEWKKTDPINYLSALESSDRNIIRHLKSSYGNFTQSEIIHFTYSEYPYYAINSKIVEEVLQPSELIYLKNTLPSRTGTAIYTIGYEGLAIEEYLNKLIINDIKILCDVRNNPQSMKFGFSKSQLQKICESLGIIYMHFPEVGIKSEERQNLKSQSDYNKLFEKYRSTTLFKTTDDQRRIKSLLVEHKRIALTCFEKDICQCHRKSLSESISQLDGDDIEIRHL
ncbi:MAG TPA: DUF488 family protein [Flavilitoribacter sp.]|nr:DUF488 family protein [Flavilitoribacter sp.]